MITQTSQLKWDPRRFSGRGLRNYILDVFCICARPLIFGSIQIPMPLEIPNEDAKALAAIQALPAASVDKLIALLGAAPPVSNNEEMAKYVGKQGSPAPYGQLFQIIQALYTLYYIRELSGVTADKFLEDLMEGIRNVPELKASEKEIRALQSRLEKLLSIDTFKTISKAARLQRDGERLYCEAKILSDIRPVFGADPTVRPAGAVLTHTFKVAYHEGRDHREFHIVLDSDDLRALSDVVRRAQAKDKTLRDLLKSAKLSNLGE
jgi:hypothetical protein